MSSTIITICHLYADIMSTYGDRGNVLYLSHFLTQQGINHVITRHCYGQSIKPATIYVFGGGQDASQTLVAKDLQDANGIRLKYYLQKSYCLAICGGYQLLVRYYLMKNGQRLDGLGYLPIATVASDDRLVGPVVIKRPFNGINRTIVGFENHSGKTFILDDSPPLGQVLKGGGNNGNDQTEGIIFNKTIGTYLHGPVLPRNPHLAYWWLRDLVNEYQRYIEPNLIYEKQAHYSYLRSS